MNTIISTDTKFLIFNKNYFPLSAVFDLELTSFHIVSILMLESLYSRGDSTTGLRYEKGNFFHCDGTEKQETIRLRIYHWIGQPFHSMLVIKLMCKSMMTY
jgi:hypothetical protein